MLDRQRFVNDVLNLISVIERVLLKFQKRRSNLSEVSQRIETNRRLLIQNEAARLLPNLEASTIRDLDYWVMRVIASSLPTVAATREAIKVPFWTWVSFGSIEYRKSKMSKLIDSLHIKIAAKLESGQFGNPSFLDHLERLNDNLSANSDIESSLAAKADKLRSILDSLLEINQKYGGDSRQAIPKRLVRRINNLKLRFTPRKKKSKSRLKDQVLVYDSGDEFCFDDGFIDDLVDVAFYWLDNIPTSFDTSSFQSEDDTPFFDNPVESDENALFVEDQVGSADESDLPVFETSVDQLPNYQFGDLVGVAVNNSDAEAEAQSGDDTEPDQVEVEDNAVGESQSESNDSQQDCDDDSGLGDLS